MRKINKTKGVEICVDLMFLGTPSKDIVRELTEKYGVSQSAVEKWMKAARPMVMERRADVKEIMDKELKATTIELAKELGLELRDVLKEYRKIAMFDIRKAYTIDGGLKPIHELDDDTAGAIAGIESFEEKTTVKEDGEAIDTIIQGTNRKIKFAEKRGALDSISKILGYTIPVKLDLPADLDLESLTITFK